MKRGWDGNLNDTSASKTETRITQTGRLTFINASEEMVGPLLSFPCGWEDRLLEPELYRALRWPKN
jgi:hypothetical protein